MCDVGDGCVSCRDSSDAVGYRNIYNHNIRCHLPSSRSARLCACIPKLSISLTPLASGWTFVPCHQRLPSPLERSLSFYLQRAHFAAMACPNEDGSVQIVPNHILEMKALSNNPSLPEKTRLKHRQKFYTACLEEKIFMPPPHQSTPPAYPQSVHEEWKNAELCDRMGLLPPINVTHFSDFEKHVMKIAPWIRAMIFGDVATELGLNGDEITQQNITSRKRRLLLAVHPDCKGRTHSMNLEYANFCSGVVEYGISRFGTQDQFREFWNPRSKCAATPPGGPDLPFAEREMCSGCVDCRCPCGTPARVCVKHQVKLDCGGNFNGYKGCPQDVDIDLGMNTEGSTEMTYRRITMMDTPPSTWKQCSAKGTVSWSTILTVLPSLTAWPARGLAALPDRPILTSLVWLRLHRPRRLPHHVLHRPRPPCQQARNGGRIRKIRCSGSIGLACSYLEPHHSTRNLLGIKSLGPSGLLRFFQTLSKLWRVFLRV